jgi:hypothetical protein
VPVADFVEHGSTRRYHESLDAPTADVYFGHGHVSCNKERRLKAKSSSNDADCTFKSQHETITDGADALLDHALRRPENPDDAQSVLQVVSRLRNIIDYIWTCRL